MNIRTIHIIASLFIAFLVLPINADAQYWGTKKKKKFNPWDEWYFNVNFGKSSFYGDVSIFDDNFNEKLSKESDWAYGFIVRKEINPVISVGGQLLFAKLKGENARSHFYADILEYNLNVALNVVNLLLPENDAKLFLYGILGAGQFLFSSTMIFDDGITQGEFTEDTGVPEFVYMFGAEAGYKMTDNLHLMGGLVLRQARNDKLDVTTSKDDWDYYSYLKGGLTYYLKQTNTTARNIKKIKGRYPMRKR